MSSSVDKPTSGVHGRKIGSLLPRGVLYSIRVGLIGFGLLTLGNLSGWWQIPRPGSEAPDLCLFHRTTGWDCPGCGMGRSLAHVSYGDLAGSFSWHPFGIPLLLGAVFFAVFPLRSATVLRRVAPLGLLSLIGWWAWVKVF